MSDDDLVRVLIVEDNATNRLALRLTLNEYKQIKIAGEAADGKAAIKMAQELKPNVILMDIGLPDIDGISATKLIKSSLPHVKIVMLTSHENPNDHKAALAAGADAYCIKDISTNALVWVITNVLDTMTWSALQLSDSIIDSFSTHQLPIESFSKTLAVDLRTLDGTGIAEETSELLEMYLSSGVNSLNQINNGIVNHNQEILLNALTELKGTSAVIGMNTIVNLCRQLETSINCQKWEQVKKGNKNLKVAFEQVIEFVKGHAVDCRSQGINGI